MHVAQQQTLGMFQDMCLGGLIGRISRVIFLHVVRADVLSDA